jgi:hypothetical protein
MKFIEWAVKEDFSGYDIATGLRNILANARDMPAKWLGSGLDHALKAAREQGNAEGVRLVQNLQNVTMGFLNRIRDMGVGIYDQRTGSTVSPRMPRRGESGFEEYQREWLRFSEDYARLLKQFSQQQSLA